MADLQMSHTGPFFQKISLFDSNKFSFAFLAGSEDEANVLNYAQDAGERDKTCTGRMCCIHEKIARKKVLALHLSLHLHALTLLYRIWDLFPDLGSIPGSAKTVLWVGAW